MTRVQVARLVVGAVLLAAIVAPFGAMPVGATQQGAMGAPAGVNPDAVHLAIAIQPNGTAQWTVEYRVRLTNENETKAFQSIADDVHNNSTAYRDRFASRINGTVADAQQQTGRQMSATDFNVTADIRELPQRYGVLTYTFTWHHFATTDGSTVTAGDALEGFFLDSQTTLLISWPTNYHATTVAPSPTERRSNAVTWTGPLDFASGEPRVAVAPGAVTTGTTASPMPPGSASAWLLVAAVFVALAAIGLAVVWYYRSGGGTAGVLGSSDDGSGGVVAAGGAAAEPEPPEELLSNEERVKRYLADHGGRAKQQEIVEGLDWTEAKTSQVLSDMQGAGEIDKFRIGRENVVKLPDEEEPGP